MSICHRNFHHPKKCHNNFYCIKNHNVCKFSSCWCKDLLSPTYLLWMIIMNCVCVSLSCSGRTTTMNTLRRNRGESLSMMMFPSAVMTRVWLSTETRLTPTLMRMDPLLASTRTAGDPRARLGPPSQPFRERTPPPPPHLCIPSVYHSII